MFTGMMLDVVPVRCHMPHPMNPDRVTPLLYVGSSRSPVVERLRACGVGVIVAERPERGLRLLTEFRVAGVVYDVPSLGPVLDFVALGAPVVLLGVANGAWGSQDVTVLGRDVPAPTMLEALESSRQSPAAA